MSGRAVIVSAGRVTDPERLRARLRPRPDDRVIAADGGLALALAMGLRPERVVGDFDSLPGERWPEVERLGAEVVRVPREKDETDTELAIRTALAWGCTEIVLVGGVGSRLDHSLANLFMLASLPPGVRGMLLDEQNEIHFLRSGEEVRLPARPGAYLSLVPLTPEVTGVEAAGVRWPLQGARLIWSASLGVSNEFTAPEARVRVGSGCLAVVVAEE
ncbi:MAG: thiamine diphosphokinase [Bacillota bacterium]|nr:MAG: thiamine diphosphokinase [Bacillota bacterium]